MFFEKEELHFVSELFALDNDKEFKKDGSNRLLKILIKALKRLEKMSNEIEIYQEFIFDHIPDFVVYHGKVYGTTKVPSIAYGATKIELWRGYEHPDNKFVSIFDLEEASEKQVKEFETELENEREKRIEEEQKSRDMMRRYDEQRKADFVDVPVDNYCSRCQQTPCMCSDPF